MVPLGFYDGFGNFVVESMTCIDNTRCMGYLVVRSVREVVARDPVPGQRDGH